MQKMGQDVNNAQLNTEQGSEKITDNQEVKSEVKQENVKQSDTISKGE